MSELSVIARHSIIAGRILPHIDTVGGSILAERK